MTAFRTGEKKIAVAKHVSILALLLLAGGCHRARVITARGPTPAVPPPPPAPTCSLTAEPATVTQGQSVGLSWTSQNGTDFDLQPGLGKQQAQSSTSATPQESTTYTFTVTGPGGTTRCTARVTVTVAPPPTPSVTESNIEGAGGFSSSMIKDAYFEFDRYDLRPDARQVLAADAGLLKAHPDIKFTVEGHCDARGSEEYNLGLGDLRATAAKNFLMNLGVSADRISAISYGKVRPICTEANEDCWKKNRRAHLKLK